MSESAPQRAFSSVTKSNRTCFHPQKQPPENFNLFLLIVSSFCREKREQGKLAGRSCCFLAASGVLYPYQVRFNFKRCLRLLLILISEFLLYSLWFLNFLLVYPQKLALPWFSDQRRSPFSIFLWVLLSRIILIWELGFWISLPFLCDHFLEKVLFCFITEDGIYL